MFPLQVTYSLTFATMEIIYSYTRAQAIEDGVLVDVSNIAKSVGYRCPVALTCQLWSLLAPNYRKRWVACLLEQGRNAAQRKTDDRVIYYAHLECVDFQHIQPIKMVISPGDNGEPVITVMCINEG